MTTGYDEAAEANFIRSIRRVADKTGFTADQIFGLKEALQEEKRAIEQASEEAKRETIADRAAAKTALPTMTAPFRASGNWPPKSEICEMVGLKPTRSNIGWLNHQLKLAYQPQPAAAD